MIKFNRCEEFESVLGVKPITEDIYFFCGERNKFWKPRTVFGIVKDNTLKRVNIRKDVHISIVDDVDKNNLDDEVEKGRVIRYTSDELVEIAKELGYLVPVSEDNIRSVVNWFIHGIGEDYEYGMEWGNKIKSILTDEEKALFHEWEEIVGYEDIEYPDWMKRLHRRHNQKETRRRYNCEDWELESALYVVMNSERLLDCAIFLKNGITEVDLHQVWNYLVSYKYQDAFVETMHFSDWEDNDPDTLKEKYSIRDEKVDYEDKSFIRRNDASVYEGDDYKMAMQICAGFDDWDGFAVVVKKDCKYSPLELVNAGESMHWIKNNFHVKTKLVVRS